MTVRTVALALAAVGTAFGGAVPANAAERPGQLDATLATFPLSRIEALDVGGDGRIVVAGRSEGYPLDHPWVRAYLPSGGPDAAFGPNGAVQLEDDRRIVVETVVQPDGRVLVAQTGDPNNQPAPHIVRRLTRDGRPDPSFGGTGSIEPYYGATPTWLTDIALQPDGRLVVVGGRAATSSGPVVTVVARYLPDGSPDAGFGSNGVTELPAGASNSLAVVALQPRGGLLLTASRDRVPVIARLSPAGQLDRSFGDGGLVSVEVGRSGLAPGAYPYGPSSAINLRDGRIRLALAFSAAREPQYRMGLVGLTRDGRLDRRFGLRGRALGPVPRRGGESVQTAVPDNRGATLVAGARWDGSELAFDSYTLMRRFRADGSLDRSFGDRGVVRGPLPGSGYPVFEQRLAILDEDTLVAAEHTYDGKYGFWGPATLYTRHAGYDDHPPRISIVVRGCRSVGLRITDLSPLDRVVVRAGGRVVRKTSRKRFRVRVPSGTPRISIRATDLAENTSAKRLRLPSC